MNTILAILIIVLVISLGILFFVKHSVVMVEVELDPDDPEVQKMIEERNQILSPILGHLGLILNISPENIDKNCEVDNLDENHSNLEITYDDLIIKLRFTWNKKVKIILFRNEKMQGKITQKTKTFWIKNKEIAPRKITKFITNFKNKAYPNTPAHVAKLSSDLITMAGMVVQESTADEIKDLLIRAAIDFNLEDYKKPEYGNLTYVAILAFLMKNYKEDLSLALKKDKEPK